MISYKQFFVEYPAERYYYIQNRFLLLKFVNISYLYEKTGCKIRSNQLY